jgi:hypothetical protein
MISRVVFVKGSPTSIYRTWEQEENSRRTAGLAYQRFGGGSGLENSGHVGECVYSLYWKFTFERGGDASLTSTSPCFLKAPKSAPDRKLQMLQCGVRRIDLPHNFEWK